MQPDDSSKTILDERFNQPSFDARLRWLNPPPVCHLDCAASMLVVQPAADTDFWQETHYGFRKDNGHFLFTEITGDFTLTTKVRFHPAHQYDQAGLMIRVGPSCWLKTSVEYEPHGPAHLGVVVTNHGFSDWSVQDFPRERNEICLRIRKEASDFIVEFAPAEQADWNLMRIAHLHLNDGAPLHGGLYACSPKGGGFRAEFHFLNIIRRSG